MQVWNLLRAAHWKCRTQTVKNVTFGHHRTTLLGYIFATKAHIDNWKNLLNSNVSPTWPQNMVYLRPTSGWDLLASLGHTSIFQQVLRLGSITARHSSSGRQPNFAALNRGCHLYLAGRPSRWALAHILVYVCYCETTDWWLCTVLQWLKFRKLFLCKKKCA